MEPHQQGIQFRPGAFGDYLHGAAVSPIVRVSGESSFQGLVPHKLPEVHSLHATMYQGGKSKEIAHITSVSGPSGMQESRSESLCLKFLSALRDKIPQAYNGNPPEECIP